MNADITVEQLIAKANEMAAKAAELKATAEKLQKQQREEASRYHGLPGFEPPGKEGDFYEILDNTDCYGQLRPAERDDHSVVRGPFVFASCEDAERFISAMEVLLQIRRQPGQVGAFSVRSRYSIRLERVVVNGLNAGESHVNRPSWQIGDVFLSVAKFSSTSERGPASFSGPLCGFFSSADSAARAVEVVGPKKIAAAMKLLGGVE